MRALADAHRVAGEWRAAAPVWDELCAAEPSSVACAQGRRARAVLEAQERCASGGSCEDACAWLPNAAHCDRVTCAADGAGCRTLARAILEGVVPGTPDEAAELLWKGCAANEAWSCVVLAEAVDGGAALPKSARGGPAWLRDQACDLQLAYACAEHAW